MKTEDAKAVALIGIWAILFFVTYDLYRIANALEKLVAK